jgi:hypothetical protein
MASTLEARRRQSIPLAAFRFRGDEVAEAAEVLRAGGAAVEVRAHPRDPPVRRLPGQIGVVEIAASILVALKPRYGAYVVAAWLAGIVVNLLTYSGYYDIALRDFGLMLGALTLARLAQVYDPPGTEVRL